MLKYKEGLGCMRCADRLGWYQEKGESNHFNMNSKNVSVQEIFAKSKKHIKE